MGPLLCVADRENFNLLDLRNGSLLPVMPLSQSGEAPPAKPIITGTGANEFLIVSAMEGRGFAIFISDRGDPVRGTFEYSNYPVAVSKSLLND